MYCLSASESSTISGLFTDLPFHDILIMGVILVYPRATLDPPVGKDKFLFLCEVMKELSLPMILRAEVCHLIKLRPDHFLTIGFILHRICVGACHKLDEGV